jgi:hypothetical protein
MEKSRRKVVLDWQPKRVVRACDHPECEGAGEYRAPRARDPAQGHFWFCLDHVRAYNSAWDFFSGMSQAEIEAYQRRNPTWHRPTWKLGDRAAEAGGGAGSWANVWVTDDLGLLAEVGLDPSLFGVKRKAAPAMKPEHRRALSTLDLKASVSLAEIKARFKELAKRYHPDTHGGDKAAEERFKQISQAYTYLLSCGYT